MCSTILMLNIDPENPILIGTNRDEQAARPALGPDRHWKQHTNILAPFDIPGKGTWLGINDEGIACILTNRRSSQSNAEATFRSRGEIVINCLARRSLNEARDYVKGLDTGRYQGFHVLLAADATAFLLSSRDEHINEQEISTGLHIISSAGINDPACPKSGRFLVQAREDINNINSGQYIPYLKEILSKPSLTLPTDGFVIDLPTGRQTRSSCIMSIKDQRPQFFLYAPRENGKILPYVNYIGDPKRPLKRQKRYTSKKDVT